MKKSICLILALLMVLSLTACGGDADVSGQVNETPNTPATIPGGTVEQPEETVPAATEAPEDNLQLGRMQGGSYTNEYVGYVCTLDSNWIFMSAEELQQIPSTVSDAISGSELAKALEGVQQFTDMMAENATDLTSINVLYQKLSLQERLGYLALSEEEIMEGILEQQETLAQAYAQAGITLISMEVVKVNFLGEERLAMHTEAIIHDAASGQEIPYYILQIQDFHLGSYAVTTTMASYLEDNTSSLLGLFTGLEQ